MKTIWKIVLGISGSVILIVINILIVVLADAGLRHIWWAVGLVGLVWLVVGISQLILRYKKKPLTKEKLDIDTAKLKAIHTIKYDTENPDNFHISDEIQTNKGEGGKDKTPIVWLPGTGTENNTKIDVLVNLNDPKGKLVIMRNKEDNFVKQIMEEFAENPSQRIIEERIRSTDTFGRPIETVKTTKAGEAKKQEEEDKQKQSAF